MSDFEVSKTRFAAGIWEAIVQNTAGSDAEPEIGVSHLGQPLDDVALTADDSQTGRWFLQVHVPIETLGDGVQVYLVNDRETGDKLASFTIVSGEPLEDDIRAEVELLRAELDMMKRAFRRHCLETS